MTWRQLACKITLHNTRRYLGYLASSALAVLVFFMFSCFSQNNAVKHGYMTQSAAYVFGGCEYIVIFFAVLFILFFHAALIRMRSKEFGLFRVLGMGPTQVWRMVFTESVFLGVLAMVVGMAAGTLFLKLFLMAMGRILELPTTIPFEVPTGAVVSTVFIFGVLFVVEGWLTASRAAMRTPKSLLLADRTRQKPPRTSWLGVVAGLVALGLGYYLAVGHSLQSTTMYFFPILILVSIGTYLLFSQISVLVLNLLRKRPLNGIQLLVTGRFAHRMKDNARVLTVVTLLSAVVLTSMASMFRFQSILHQNSTHIDPFTVMTVNRQSQPGPLTPEQVQAKLRAAGTPASQMVSASVSVATIRGQSQQRGLKVVLVSESTFEHVRQALVNAEPALRPYLKALAAPQPGHANLYVPYPLVMPRIFTDPHIRVMGVLHSNLVLNGQSDTRIFNEQGDGGLPEFVLVVSDADYVSITSSLPDSAKYTLHGFSVPKWKQSQAVVQVLKSELPKSGSMYLTDRITADSQTRQIFSVMLFAGFFISALFLLACASAIYFRIQAQYESDRSQYFSLRRMGMQRQEMGRVLTAELFLLFFVPVGVALVHSAFAMVDFSHLITLHRLDGSTWPIFLGVVGIYALFTAVYFMVARARYLAQVADSRSR